MCRKSSILNKKYKKLASTFRVLQNTNNVIIFMLLESLSNDLEDNT